MSVPLQTNSSEQATPEASAASVTALDRRHFLKRAGQMAMAGVAMPMGLNLAAISDAAAFSVNMSDPNDYKALVCVFLQGANDYANTVVTYDNASYDQYSAIRGGGPGRTAGGIALAQGDLTPSLLTPAPANVPVDSLGVPRQFALHPNLAGVANLFNTGKAAVLLNVGPLVKPLTRAQYDSRDHQTYPRPPKLFSHNDQQSIWQSSQGEGSKIGWGGNIGDLSLSSNQGASSVNSLFTCISPSGNTVFLSGDQALQYQVVSSGNDASAGAIKISAGNGSVYGNSGSFATFMKALVTQSRTHALEKAYNTVTARSASAESVVTAALATSTLNAASLFTSSDSLTNQMRIVARLISVRAALGLRRQVFFVQLGGFDLHDNLISQQPRLMTKVNDALTQFYNATVAMGIANKVTCFTASDFGRTLTSNGDGSDHGWGSHHLIVGGAVNGAKFYGTAPPVSVSDAKDSMGNYLPENRWHVGQGRLLPTTSVDQYASTLAQWFGVSAAEIPGALPNIANFGTAPLGFV